MRVSPLTPPRIMPGRSAGALSVSGVLTSLDNCTFDANISPSGPAVFIIGTVFDPNPMDLEFASNSLACDDGQFIDYADPILSDDAAASVNVSAEVTLRRLGWPCVDAH